MAQSEKLFRAVVVFGASLTACEREPTKDVTIQPLPAPSASTTTTTTTTTTSEVHDAPPASTGTTVLRRADAGCPPGSELPYPPCYYIR